MHELSIAEAILDRAREAAADHGTDELDALTVELGTATHINPDQLQFCLETVAETKDLADVSVTMGQVDPVAECDCGWKGEPPSFEGTAASVPAARCPECGSRTEFTQGTECRLSSIEVPAETNPE